MPDISTFAPDITQDQPKVILVTGSNTYFLPMPTNLELGTNYNWDSAGGAMLAATRSLLKKYQDGTLGQSVMNTSGMLSNDSLGQIKSKAADYAASLSSMTETGSYVNRRAKNPKQVIMFRGVSQRTFSMDFSLAAKSENDMAQYMKILNSLTVDAAPTVKQEIFFEWPEPCYLIIVDKGKEVIKTREVQIMSINVDLTPNGVWSTYAGGTPTNVRLTINFTETKIPTKENDKNLFG